MMKLLVVLLLIFNQGFGDDITDGTKLIGTFLMHRHGDRTPTESSAALATDVDAVVAASAQYGWGQLTEVGKQRAYKLGETIRSRYDELLSSKYNRSEIYIRSTDSTRAKMTILNALAAIYPAYSGSWSDEINWVPVPYTTVPAKWDFNLASLNCPNLLAASETLMYSNPARMSKYSNALEVVSEVSGYNITTMPCLAYMFYDVYVAQNSLGVPVSDEIADILEELGQAADEAADVLLGNSDYIALESGPLLNEVLTYMDELINGTDTPRVRIYSAHDMTVFGYEAVAQIIPRQGVPAFASYFALELRQVEETGQYVILPVYQSTPGADVVYVPVDGCDDLPCDYDTYKEIVSPYVLDEDTWRWTSCGFTQDLVVDDSSIA